MTTIAAAAAAETKAAPPAQASPDARRSGFYSVLRRHMRAGKLSAEGSLLAVGASGEDAGILQAAGFRDITLSNYSHGREWERMAVVGSRFPTLRLDVEQLDVPDGSFDVVFAHEVLHHCRSPHRALCEMLRVARRHVVFMEPNDSWFMRRLVQLHLSSPFEVFAVVAHEYLSGGVRDTQIPNLIFRWNERDVRQTVAAFLPEEVVDVHAYPYWELNAQEFDLEIRKQTKLSQMATVFGGMHNFVRLLHVLSPALNALPTVRKQGNKFFCCLQRTHRLREWLREEGGSVVFNREYGRG